MTLTQIKFIAGGLGMLGLVGIWLYVGRIQTRAELALLRAETAEGLAATLAEANAKLKAAQAACNLAATAQSIAASAALARRDTLDEIMSCTAPVAGNEAALDNPRAGLQAMNNPKGEPLNDTQSRKLVDFYNRDVFGGLRPE